MADDTTYETFAALAAAMQTALDSAIGGGGTWLATIDAASFGEEGFDVRRADGNPFDVTFGACLAEFCNISDDTAANSVFSDGAPPFGLWPDTALVDPDCWYSYRRSKGQADGQAPTGVVRTTSQIFEAELWYPFAMQAQWRTFIGRARKGVPFRLWLDSDDANQWTEANRDGYLDLVLTHEGRTSSEEPFNKYGMMWRYQIAAHVV